MNEYNASTPNGSFGFNGTETGNAFADYLLGAPVSFQQQSYSTFFTRSNYGALFAQDSFKARPNFTINAGVRWEVSQPFYETQDRLNAIVWGMQSTKYPGSPAGWVFPGDPSIPRTISPTKWNQFSPRLGLAYSPDAGSATSPIGPFDTGAALGRTERRERPDDVAESAQSCRGRGAG